MDEPFIYLFIALIIVSLFTPNINELIAEENIENYSINEAILIDNFITFTKFGTPQYFLIYKFNDNSIKQFNVTSEQYYNNSPLSNKAN